MIKISSSLKALIWKEIRENWRWSFIAGIAVFILLNLKDLSSIMFSTINLYPMTGYYDKKALDIIWQAIAKLMSLASIIWALSLSHIQCLPEMRREQRPVFHHKPVSSRILFAGKIIPGLTLYLSPLLLAYLLRLIWISIPGNIPAPIDMYASIGGFTSILAGIPIYFAGIYCASYMHSRWTVWRVFPILTAITGALIVYCSITIELAILILCTFTILSATVAFGAYQNHKNRSVYNQVMSLLNHYISISLIFYYTSITVLPIFFNNIYGNNIYFVDTLTQTNPLISSNGQIYYSVSNNGNESVYNSNGLLADKNIKFVHKIFLSGLLDWTYDGVKDQYWNSHNALNYALITSEYWYMDHNELKGYSRDTNKLIGYITKHGFIGINDPLLHSVSLKWNINKRIRIGYESNSDRYILADNDGIYLVDYSNKIVTRLNTSLPLIDINRIGSFHLMNKTYIMVFTHSLMYIYTDESSDNKQSTQMHIFSTLPYQRNYRDIAIINKFVYLWSDNEMVKYNTSGILISKDRLIIPSKLLNKRNEHKRIDAHRLFDHFVNNAYYATNSYLFTYIVNTINSDLISSYNAFLSSELWLYFYSFMTNLLLSIALTIVAAAYLRLPVKSLFLWLVLNLFLSLPGVLTMLALHQKAVICRCSQCKSYTLVTFERCIHCKSKWAPAEMDGTEIITSTQEAIAA